MKITWIVLAALVIILVLLSIYWKYNNPPQTGILIVQGDRMSLFENWRTLEMVSIDTGHAVSFEGYPLEAFLQAAEVDDAWQRVILVSDDGGRVVLHRDSMVRPHLALVKNDGESYFRLILPDDEFAQHWLKYVRRLELE
ncbi:MAG: hypothetical protein K8R90_02910 [Candidatus Cloacimonetes bacterium]|nr:hypothetical protein [Candidatus Cloacimonadota bacterium]